jgi:hypothetical protein
MFDLFYRFPIPGDSSVVYKMEIDFAPSHNPNLFGSLSVSPPVSMFDSYSPLLHFNDEFLDALNPTTTTTTTTTTEDDEIEDWMKPLLFDQLFEYDLQQNILNLNDIEIKQEKQDDEKTKLTNCPFIVEDKLIVNNYSQSNIRENEFIDFFHQQSSEQQLPSTTTTTVRLIHQPKIEPAERPATLFVSGNELKFHSIVNNTNSKTIGHTYTSKGSSTTTTTTTSSPSISSVPIQSSMPIVPARVLKGKKFKRGGRVTSRA